jgi:hypothetical protein
LGGLLGEGHKGRTEKQKEKELQGSRQRSSDLRRFINDFDGPVFLRFWPVGTIKETVKKRKVCGEICAYARKPSWILRPFLARLKVVPRFKA